MLKSLAIAIGMLVECGLQIHTISEPFYRLNYGHILLMTSMTIFSGSASDNNSNNQKKKKKVHLCCWSAAACRSHSSVRTREVEIGMNTMSIFNRGVNVMTDERIRSVIPAGYPTLYAVRCCPYQRKDSSSSFLP